MPLIPFFIGGLRRHPAGWLNLGMKLAGKSDLIVCPPEISPRKLALLKYATGARYAAGETFAPYNRTLGFSVRTTWAEPYLETQDRIAAALGFDTPLDPPSIGVTAAEISWAKSELGRARLIDARPLVGVQCSSIEPSKRWPAENFGLTVRNLRDQFPGIGVISFGIAAEQASAKDAQQMNVDVPWLDGTGRWSIRETLAMLSQCDVFISGDTGLMHMAAALRTPTVSIFGTTSAIRRAPHYNGGAALSPTASCHPCFRGQWIRCDCIRQITPEQVSSAASCCLESNLATQ
ncbi:MAG: glycosyltransferase family 9 protein [Candidatus Acidiferrales bacterium]